MARSGRARVSRPISVIKRTRLPLYVSPSAAAGGRQSRRLARHTRWEDILLDLPWALASFLSYLQWHRLDFYRQQQQQTYWCWAATASSVSLYYDPASTWTQCAVVNQELNLSTCCQNGDSQACNTVGSGKKALTIVGHLGQHLLTSSTYDQVTAAIDAGQPLGIRILWNGGAGTAHILAIAGYNSYLNMIGVEDPIFGASDVDYASFPANYQGGATWVESYFTKA